MSRTFYEMAKKNYPANWNRDMVDHFLKIGRLTEEEYTDVVKETDGENEDGWKS